MKELFFKCTLTSDVVLNSTLATEGNLASLDYIPGSNFLGIVANQLYKEVGNEKAYDLFHSGKVKFGDATIYSEKKGVSYPIPFSFFKGKNEKNDANNDVKFYLHHSLDSKNLPKDESKNRIQLKQERQGYVFADGSIQNTIEKSFSLKSAQDRKTRSSKDGQMFGFESISKGQVFSFSLQFEDESLLELVKSSLIGNKRLGKSKSSEFGQVAISELDENQEQSVFKTENYTLVYAQSNLCFFDENGSPTFQPLINDLGLENGEIIWEKSQIRTYSYSPWNFTRNASNTERHCIAKGSVFYIEGNTTLKNNLVGLFQNEGLGRVVYNPFFLEEGVDSKTKLEFKLHNNILEEDQKKEKAEKPITETKLGKFLNKQVEQKNKEKDISSKIHEIIYRPTEDIKRLIKISSSQWGGIRSFASKAENMDELRNNLFDKDKGYLTHGVADLKYWGLNKGVNLRTFKSIFEDNKTLGTPFVEKFAAEMAKENKRKQNETNNG